MGPTSIIISLLKVLAVLAVFYNIFMNRERTIVTIVSASMIIVWACIARVLYSGYGGLAIVLLGIIVGALCSVSRYRSGRIKLEDFITSMAVGGLTGPVGAFILFTIVFLLSVFERVMHAGTTSMLERHATSLVEPSMLYPVEEYKSPLAKIGSGIATRPGRTTTNPIEALGIPPGFSIENLTFPWSAKIALATLSVMFIGTLV
ncbi:MAG: hypothetical protein KAV42_05950 [Candidatus Krumholzibacteria bacterium]|nr:hypothetical protein [Candidatus Krumholzibacteria bacterium]